MPVNNGVCLVYQRRAEMRNDGLPRDISVQLGNANDNFHLLSKGAEESLNDRTLPSTGWSFWSEEGGAAAFVFALIATGIIAAAGLGIDVISWYRADRALQNA